MITDLEQISPNKRYHTITQTLIPRPVAWVLSENDDQSMNLAPFSYFSGVASDPPLIMLSIGLKPDGTIKDTRRNIIERSHFVVHIPSRDQASAVTESSRTLAYGESELEAQKLKTVPFADFALPRLEQAPVAFACERFRVEEITETQAMILGRIRYVYVTDEAVSGTEDRTVIDANIIDPIARLGGNNYSLMGGTIDIPRPK